jgi:hypothetical protein
MKCAAVQRKLSPFLDEVLRDVEMVAVSKHLADCDSCRSELVQLERLRKELGSLERVQPPDYLQHLLQIRLASEKRLSWSDAILSALQLRWSRFRHIESSWYITRLLGTAVTFVFFFFVLSAALSPIYFGIDEKGVGSGVISHPQQLASAVLKKLGLPPVEEQTKPMNYRNPQINDLYLVQYGEKASLTSQDDTLSVVAFVDPDGFAKIDNVLEYPTDGELLADCSEMITRARWWPASHNGIPVESRLVFTFHTISVHD